ncbi:Pol polyprotein [Dorcoceras hygrometricum]|uniref:Pol polyprotein n=1 Tax=Dorcoceras hygrometricum TaxID=472368 RepID=A0A2Z7CHJ0_9LAMI|nr:Pol polyprotein [Dorcoceras hygrometricum]
METLLKQFQSFKPPTLAGTENAIECESWLEDIEQLFEALDYTDDRRVKLIVHQLHGLGKSWWIVTKRALENQGTVITWAVFRTAFYQRFFPVSYRKDKGAEFANLRQGPLSIEEYVAKFTSLLKFAPHVAISDEAQADQFINGLNPDVFTLVNTGRPNTFADALNRAKGAEARLLRQQRAQFGPTAAKAAQENPQIPPPPRFDTGSSSSGKKNFFTGIGKQFKRSGTSSSSSSCEFKQLGAGQEFGDYCTKCGGRHATEQCRGVSDLCRICNQPGHFARICPQRNSENLQNSEASRTIPIPERQASSVYSFQTQNQQQGRQGGSQTVSQPPKQQARVFALTEEQVQAAPDDVIAGNCYLCNFLLMC